MKKYFPLFEWIAKNQQNDFVSSFEEIGDILGFEIDHSFLQYKTISFKGK